MCRSYRWARFDAQFVQEAVAQVAVDGEGFGSAAGAVEGEHQLAVVGLAEWVFGRQGRQLRDQGGESGAADGQLGVVAPLQQEEAGLREALGERVSDGLGREAGQRGAAPQGEGGRALSEDALPVLVGVGGPRPFDVCLEDVHVQLARADPQEIAGRYGAQPSRIVQEPAQPGHVVVQRGLRGHRRRPAPQRVLERLDRDDPAGFEEQGGEQRPYLDTADRLDSVPGKAVGGVAAVQDGRAQQPEPQTAPHVLAPLPCRPPTGPPMLAICWRGLM